MFRAPTLLLALSLCTCVSAQDSTYVQAETPMSMARIAMHYMLLDWTEEQWDSLRGKRVEMLYLIDEIGEPILEAVRGVDQPDILDSLAAATGRLPYFQPARMNGNPVESVFTLWLTFPQYTDQPRAASQYIVRSPVPTLTKEELDRDYVFDKNQAVVDMGLTYTRPIGEPSDYLKGGGGVEMMLGYRWSDRLGAGLALNLIGYGSHKPFPNDPFPTRENPSRSSGFLAGALDYNLNRASPHGFSLRGELGYAFLNAANKINPPDDRGFLKYAGLHTGVQLIFHRRLGLSSAFSLGETANVQSNNLLIYATIRHGNYGDKPATGFYFGFGVGFRAGRDFYRKKPRQAH